MGLSTKTINISDDFENDENLSEKDKQVIRDMIEDYNPEKKNVFRSVFATQEMQDIYYSKTKFILDDIDEK